MSQRTLILVRHAKTEPRNAGGDHARRLEDRGMRQAAMLGRLMRDEGVASIGLAITSDAVRAEQTTEQILLAFPGTDVWRDRHLYDAGPDEVLDVVHEAGIGVESVAGADTSPDGSDNPDVLMIVGHEPTISATVGMLAADQESEDLVWGGVPTATALIGRFDGEWADLTWDSISGWRKVHVSASTA